VLFRQLLRGQGARAIYVTFAIWAITDLLLELPFLAAGMYTYYGDQPFLIRGFPLHWVVFNGLVPAMSGMLMYLVVERWPSGRHRAAWRVAATPALAAALLMLPIFPVAAALNAEVPTAVRWIAAAMAIAISLGALVAFAQLAERELVVPAGRSSRAGASARH